jgi:hypothetical protein
MNQKEFMMVKVFPFSSLSICAYGMIPEHRDIYLRKDTASADVFVCVFTSAYNRDVAANLCNKILAHSSTPPPSLCPSTLWKM